MVLLQWINFFSVRSPFFLFLMKLFNFFFFVPDQQCDSLLDPMNGEVHQTGRHLGDRAIYTCAHGWEIIGDEERVCQSDGQWSNQEPFCKKRGTISYQDPLSPFPVQSGFPDTKVTRLANAIFRAITKGLFMAAATEVAFSSYHTHVPEGCGFFFIRNIDKNLMSSLGSRIPGFFDTTSSSSRSLRISSSSFLFLRKKLSMRCVQVPPPPLSPLVGMSNIGDNVFSA